MASGDIAVRRITSARFFGDESTRRAIAAVPLSIVIFFFTVLFTVIPAALMLQGNVAELVFRGTFSTAAWGTVAVVVLGAAFSVTVGKRLDLYTQRFADVVAVAIFTAVGAILGLVASLALYAAVASTGAEVGSEALGAILLVVCLPAAISAGATRLVVGPSAESWQEFAIACVVALLTIGLFLWVAAGQYPLAS